MKVILEAHKIPVGSWVSDEIGTWTWAEQCRNPMRIVREITITDEAGQQQTIGGGPYLIDPQNGRITAISASQMLCWTPSDNELLRYMKEITGGQDYED